VSERDIGNAQRCDDRIFVVGRLLACLELAIATAKPMWSGGGAGWRSPQTALRRLADTLA